jgi:hypothetical protein
MEKDRSILGAFGFLIGMIMLVGIPWLLIYGVARAIDLRGK